ncbi:MAG: hypothetical protein ABIP28_07685 [Mucilaginibacter sp.]
MNPEQENKDPYVSKAQLDKLIANYQQKVKRVRKGSNTVQDHDPKIDSKSLWFSRKAIEEFLDLNDADGLRIYLGVHDTAIMPTEYDDKLTVVLVATKNVRGVNQDQLFDPPAQKTMALTSEPVSRPGGGLNHAIICPPNNCP